MTMGIRDNAINAHRMLIIDARSYSAAIANRAKGGGCECAGKFASNYLCDGWHFELAD